MPISIPARGTRGGKPMPFRRLMNVLGRPYVAMVKRPNSKMRVAGQPLLVLRTIGATSGQEREAVLGFWPDEAAGAGAVLVVGSNMGAAGNPAWLFNIARHPDKVWVERDGTRTRVQAETLEGEERASVWTNVVAKTGRYASYLDKTDREIPIVRLRPVADS